MTQIALTLIVKNEAPTIAQTLASARAALGPGPTLIVDTGSTDGTVDEINRWACEVWEDGLGPVFLHFRPFDDFASSRNHALKLAWEQAPLAFMVSAGAIVRGRAIASPVVQPMTARTRLGNLEYVTPRIFPRGWRYVGKVHEYAEGPGKLVDSGLIVDYCLKDDERPRRWVRDLALLEDDFTPRGRFYYAQTLECLGRRSQALSAYLARAEIEDGFWQERVISLIRAIPLAGSWADAELYARKALELDGSRGEAWLALARLGEKDQAWAYVEHCAQKAIACVPRHGALFVDVDREWRANLMIGDSASSRGEFGRACSYWRRALELAGDRMPATERAQLELGLSLHKVTS